MSSQRFTPEFKEEAVRQIIDRKYSVAEVSARQCLLAVYTFTQLFDLQDIKSDGPASSMLSSMLRQNATLPNRRDVA